SYSATYAGGWNGGGTGNQYGMTGGGGATDVRFGGRALSNRIIVAGGGGGAGNSQNATVRSDGGAGGGTVGVQMPRSTQFHNRTAGEGGTQTTGNELGVGANSRGNNLRGGGGGGYWGGKVGDNSTGGGGGSGYIGGVTSGQTIAGNSSMPAPGGGTMTGRSGHGYVEITYSAIPGATPPPPGAPPAAGSAGDAGACRADVVFLMDNTGSMGGPITSTKRNASTILDAISGGDPRFAGIDTRYAVATYWGDPREYMTGPWYCARETCPWWWCARYWCEGGTWPHYCSHWGYCGSKDPTVAAQKAFKINQSLTDSHSLTRKAMNEWRPCSSPGGCGGDWAEANFFALHQLATGGGSTDGTCIDSPGYGMPSAGSCSDKGFATGYDVGWREDSGRIIVWFGDACSWSTTVDRSEVTAALTANNIIVAGINTYSKDRGIDYRGNTATGSCAGGSGATDGQASVITNATHGTLTNNVSGTKETVNAILDAVAGGIAQSGSAAAVSFSTASLTEGSQLYQTRFNAKDWSGDVAAYSLKSDNDKTEKKEGGQIADEVWSAAEKLDSAAPENRVMMTRGAADGVPFQWSSLTSSQQQDLRTEPAGGTGPVSKGQARLNYLRGDHSNEITGLGFRYRGLRRKDKDCKKDGDEDCSWLGGRLGDIWHSSAIYVGKPNQGWPNSGGGFPEGANKYSTFASNNSGRTPVVYVGANDGFMHGFDAKSGKEVIAYAPSNLFSNSISAGFHRLTDPNFNHNNLYVDGTPTVSDAFIGTTNVGTKAWRTILIGTEGGGGRGLFALDVTNPNSATFRESNAANVVLWEFANSHDPHLGYTFSQPTIALLNNGRWAAITGNGLDDTATDSTGGQSQLFIIYLDGGLDGAWTYGSDYLRIPTGSGSSGNRNGLFTPAIVDLDGNGTADRVYAGDLKANLWAFDLSSSDQNSWGVAHGKKPLFSGNANQPITVQPTVIHHPTEGSGAKPSLMVLFGTGRFLSGADKTRSYQQSFYGIWDNGTSSLERSNLAAQTFLLDDASKRARVLNPDLEVKYAGTAGRQYGWYIDLPTTGERVVSEALVRDNIVYFNTIIPDISVCASGGSGWEMSVKTDNGGSPDEAAFDFNGNHIVGDSEDSYTIAGEKGKESTVGYAGRKMEEGKGMPAGPSIIGNRRYTPGSITDEGDEIQESALSESEQPPTGRLSWEQLFAD
ncbi:MAG: PilC/PilY family type IV pilus protein, partial [Arenicellales bacterium]|nr:PilC/PilY family type IV pilus protein [Arenicellales bacterium]